MRQVDEKRRRERERRRAVILSMLESYFGRAKRARGNLEEGLVGPEAVDRALLIQDRQ